MKEKSELSNASDPTSSRDHGRAKANLPTLGDFELRREIGRGGMGTVYEAWQRSLQRTVALKVLSSHISATPKAVVRFKREAQAAAKLHHIHIVPIFAQGETDGIYYYAMELIVGESLNAIIKGERNTCLDETIAPDQAETVALSPDANRAETPQRSGTVVLAAGDGQPQRPPTASATSASAALSKERYHTVARHMADVAEALAYAHKQGVIHRDIKPHNLILGDDDRMRISDFGLARIAEQPGVTMTGEMIGSPLYMAPEQITGVPDQVDHRADIYSLGATMYEWLTLVPPYPGETREGVISKILSTEPPTLRAHQPQIPIDLETITLKAIERDPQQRYQSAGALGADLRRYLKNQPIVARRAGVATRLTRFVGRHQFAALAAIAIVTAGALAWSLRVSKKNAATQQAAALEATAVAEENRQSNELFLDLMDLIQGGTAGLAEAAIPMVQGMVTRNRAVGENANATDGAAAPAVGTPASIAHRVAEEFYMAVVPPNWPDEGTTGSDDAAVHLREAAKRWSYQDLKGARSLLGGYLSLRPDDFEAWQMHTVLCGQLGLLEEMLSDATRLMQFPNHRPRAHLWRGLAHLLLDNADASIEDLTRAASAPGESRWAKTLRGLAWITKAEPDESLPDFDAVLAEQPTFIPALLGRARALAASGKYELALVSTNEVLELEPNDADALTIRGECNAAMSNYSAAARDFQRAMNIAGRTPGLLILWGSTQLKMRQRNLPETETGEFRGDSATSVPESLGDARKVRARDPIAEWLRQNAQRWSDDRPPNGRRANGFPFRWP